MKAMPAHDTGKLIRKRRQALGMTQSKLAAEVGVDRSAVSNWERGRHFPLRFQGKVEEVLGISLDGEGLPEIVARHSDDPQVMELYNLRTLPLETRLGLIRKLLRDRGEWVELSALTAAV